MEAQLVGADKVTIEGFQDLTDQVERLDQTSRAANTVVFDLPERHGPVSPSLADAVGQQLHGAAPAFSPSAVVRAHRLRKPHGNKPRPVRITLVSADAKLAAFKARGRFRQRQLRVDHDLTRAQQKSRSERWPILQQFRQLQSELNPQFIRDLIYVWEKGRRVLLTDSEAGLRELRAGALRGSDGPAWWIGLLCCLVT